MPDTITILAEKIGTLTLEGGIEVKIVQVEGGGMRLFFDRPLAYCQDCVTFEGEEEEGGDDAAGQVLATLGGTITGTMYVEQILAMANTQLAVASWQGQGITTIDIGGSIILPPGTCLCTYTNIAGGAAGLFGSFVWQEIPI